MKHEGDLLGKMEREFNKPEEMIFRQQPSARPIPIVDPLNQLKTRFIKGEISEEKYRAKLRVLQRNELFYTRESFK